MPLPGSKAFQNFLGLTYKYPSLWAWTQRATWEVRCVTHLDFVSSFSGLPSLPHHSQRAQEHTCTHMHACTHTHTHPHTPHHLSGILSLWGSQMSIIKMSATSALAAFSRSSGHLPLNRGLCRTKAVQTESLIYIKMGKTEGQLLFWSAPPPPALCASETQGPLGRIPPPFRLKVSRVRPITCPPEP